MEKSDIICYTLKQFNKLEKIGRCVFLHNLSISNGRISKVSDWSGFVSSDEAVNGIFLTPTELSDKMDYIINSGFHIYPSYHEVILVFKEIFLKLIDSFDYDNLLTLYHGEGGPILSHKDFFITDIDRQGEIGDNLIKSLLNEDLIRIIKVVFREIVKNIIEGLPVVSDISNREYFISKTPLLGVENIDRVKLNSNKIFSFEGPQGIGKSTQIRNLRSLLNEYNIFISDNLPKDEDPSKVIVEWENKNRSVMPFLNRQRIARISYESRFDFASDGDYLSLLDRSIFSLLLFHFTMSRGTSKEDRIKDIDELRIWYTNILKKYNSKILILTNQNIFEQFFRMKKDKNYSNQNADIASQILENIFYRLLIGSGLGMEINADNLDFKEVSEKIIKIILA